MFRTHADQLIEILSERKQIHFNELKKLLDIPEEIIYAYLTYLHEEGIIQMHYAPALIVTLSKNPEDDFEFRDAEEFMSEIKILLETDKIREINRLLYDLYCKYSSTKNEKFSEMYHKAYSFVYDYLKKANLLPKDTKGKSVKQVAQQFKKMITLVDEYKISCDKFSVHAKILKQDFEPVPYYIVSLLDVGTTTRIIVEQVKNEIMHSLPLHSPQTQQKKEEEGEKDLEDDIRQRFKMALNKNLSFLFPDIPENELLSFVEYLTLTGLGFGEIEILLKDPELEEIVVNGADEPVWVYHHKHSWLKTNIILKEEERIKHYATIAGRIVNRSITLLNPLLDAHLKTGDRINATLEPITTKGNTITIRKFATKPWTITSLLNNKTIDYLTAALMWLAIQNELSLLIVGGTGSGKTSMLNVISNFFPPNQRIVSIEDTRELVLPDSLHWVPTQTKLPNPEGQGGVTMLDLVVNSLRMRPDRIIVGEIRRKAEAEVLFEAMHTGHSVYATFHANSVTEAIMRLTNPPIDISQNILGSLSLLVVQNRNRKTGTRRMFQVAEILETGEARVLFEFDMAKDAMNVVNKPKRLYETLKLFTGMGEGEITADIQEKIKVLHYLVDNNIDDIHAIGGIVSDYYTNKEFLLNRLFKQ
ncbi:CpaF family protein [Candidatus Woesearchaeota archaeon]|nr:CpaF family protein [Candidatus Woesearchaeota archaeon]